MVTAQHASMASAEVARRRRERLRAPITRLPAMMGTVGGILGRAVAPLPLDHLACVAEPLEMALRRETDQLWFAGSASVQHGKTTLLQFALGRALARDPTLRIGFGSYISSLAVDRSKQIRDVAVALGVELKPDVQAGGMWRTTSGGFVQASGVDGGYTGRNFDVFVLDDPYKNRQDAESTLHRERVETMVRIVCERTNHGVFVIHARWHPDDAIGRREHDENWEYLNLPAIAEEGVPDALKRLPGTVLWPAHPQKGKLDYFDPYKENAHDWASLFQGVPRPRGASLFERAPVYYYELPKDEPVQYAIGFDGAVTASTKSDWSVVVVLALCQGKFYVIDVWRGQVSATELRERVNSIGASYPGAPRIWMTGGQERGVADLLNQPGPKLDASGRMVGLEQGASLVAVSASGRGDKFVKALPVATEWNAGRVLVPSRPHPHMAAFVGVLRKFTGAGDAVDDDVDALGNAHYALKPYVNRRSLFDDGAPRIRALSG